MSSLDYLDLCRLCLVKNRVSVPIFEGEGDVRQIFLKIAACLPVKVTREDKLPKKICDDCVYKVELFYQFWNTTANAEKQLLQWLGEVNLEDKQDFVTNVLNTNVMKQEQNSENRLDGSVMQQVGEHQNNMGMGMMDNMGLGIPMMISNTNQQQQITSVPMDTSGTSVQPIQAVPGPSSQTTHNQISQNQSSSANQEDEEESSEDEENSDDECDGDEGLPVKEESEEDPNNRTIEPTTFVNVSLACDEAGPSGLQQKISDMPEMPIQQPADGDPKTGSPISAQNSTRQLSFYHGNRNNQNRKNKMPRKIERNRIDERALKRKKVSCLWQKKIKSKTVFNRDSLKNGTEEDSSYEVKKFESIKSEDKVKKESKGNERITQKIEVEKVLENSASKEEVDQILENLRNVCPLCQKRFNDEKQMQRHVRRVHNRPYTCNKCRKGYYSKVALKEHERSHKDDSYLECPVCHLRYKRKLGLRHHQIRVHSSVEARFTCDYCKKRFKLKIDLGLHIERTHANTVSICKFCGKSVKNVKLHEWKHEKSAKRVSFQYRCHLCPKKFRNSNNLENHLLMHKDGFKCNHCEEIFSLPSTLEKHKDLKHRPSMLCTICKKEFYSRSHFYTHVLTHAGVRPYKCDVCGEDFTQRSSLMRHRKNHPGPLPPLIGITKIADIARKILQKA